MIHCGISTNACGRPLQSGDGCTANINKVNCPYCLYAVLRTVDNTSGGWYDRDNSRTLTGEHAPVFTDAVSLGMPLSLQCFMRGVAKDDHGTLYSFTIRRRGHGDLITRRGEETRFLMSPWKTGSQTLYTLAEGLYKFEGRYMGPTDVQRYTVQMNALARRDMQDAAATLPTIIPESI